MVDQNTKSGNSQPPAIIEQNGVIASADPSKVDTKPWSVEDTLHSLGLASSGARPTSPLAFFHLIERLKTTPREGWRRFGFSGTNHGESISDHMYRMSIITMTAPATLTAKLDISRCTRMALIHDMAESLVGDITPVDPIAKSEKSRRELETMQYIANELLGNVPNGGKEAGAAMLQVWQEYEDGETAESVFVHDVDKLELLLQMVEYERKENSVQRRLDLGEFTGVTKRIVLPEMKRWAAEVLAERTAHWEGVGGPKPSHLVENEAYIAANLGAGVNGNA